MSRTRWVVSGAWSVSIALIAFSPAAGPSAAGKHAPVPGAAKAEPTIKVRLALDKTDVVVGETVRLEETIPATPAVKVTSIEHHVVRVGRYDPKSRGVVNLQPSNFVDRSRGVFVGKNSLPQCWGYEIEPTEEVVGNPKVILVGDQFPDLGKKGRRGEAVKFKPERLGIFMIWSEWDVVGDPTPWHSQPIVLVVRPPTDNKGLDIIKPEWLEDE